MKTGKDSVVIAATDSNGNTIINTPMAVGYAAKAGLRSIAIGAFAAAALPDLAFPMQLRAEMEALVNFAIQENNHQSISAIENVAFELRHERPRQGVILAAWDGVKALAPIDGAYHLLNQASTVLLAYVAHYAA